MADHCVRAVLDQAATHMGTGRVGAMFRCILHTPMAATLVRKVVVPASAGQPARMRYVLMGRQYECDVVAREVGRG